MSGPERSKPFVAMLNPRTMTYHSRETSGCAADGCYPAVVTPLLPDDPRIGEVWHDACGPDVLILSAPYETKYGRRVVIEPVGKPHDSREILVANLRRLPVLKTFALRGYARTHHDPLTDPVPARIKAESKEAALKKLAESLEEV